MNLIDPFEFRAQFSGARSLAVVGNAPTVREYQNGKRIDEHDIVVRFNRIQTSGLEEQIGSRTDILCVNAANSLSLAPSPSQTTRPKALVCFISPHWCHKADAAAFFEWVGDLPLLLTFGPDLLGLPASTRTRPLTSGTYILYTLLRMLQIERLFLTGFTMFGAVAGGAGKVYEDGRPGVGTFHDLDEEAKIFAGILQQYCGKLEMTPEVESLVARAGGRRVAADTGAKREAFGRRLANAISWRLLGAAMALRRYGELG